MTLTAKEIFLRKRSSVLVEGPSGNYEKNKAATLTLCKNLENLGYVLSKELFEVLASQTPLTIANFYKEVVPILQKIRGAHRKFEPMYPNFPKQVMEADDAELYWNAMLHYWGSAIQDLMGVPVNILPTYEKKNRTALKQDVPLTTIKLGDIDEFNNIFTQLVASNSSLSQEDKDVLKWFVDKDHDDKSSIQKLLPDSIPQKETIAMLAGWMNMPLWFAKYLKTATDILRVAVVLSDGDVSLAKPTKFKSLKRSERRFFMKALEAASSRTEDMLRFPEAWKRLAERLHPGEFKNYPQTIKSFDIIRKDLPFETYNSKVEKAIRKTPVKAIDLLCERPGVFARRLDHVLRLSAHKNVVINRFLSVASNVATPILVQMYQHFQNRNAIRAFMPKGQLAKMQVSEETLPEIKKPITDYLVQGIRGVLVERFSKMPSLGSCYVDPMLQNHKVPTAQRSASKALRTLARGSRIDLPPGNCLRFFLWWKNGDARTDIDLSAVLLDDDFNYVDLISYYNLRGFDGAHSGDIVDAPNGACEFIDISLASKTMRAKGRYVCMSMYSYTQQPYCDLPECFGGWMIREKAQSGEIFEPKTVVDKVDVASKTKVVIPVIIDLETRQVVWTDLSLSSQAKINNVESNKMGLGKMAKAMCNYNRANLYDLFSMHVEARGELTDKVEATNIFSLHEGITPFDNDRIMSEFLA